MKLLEMYQMKQSELRTLRNERFTQSYVSDFQKNELICQYNSLNIYPVERQTVFGFGCAASEGAAYVYSQMNEENRRRVLELLLGDSGLRQTFFRIHIGSCDYSPEEYMLVEDGDYELKTFSIDHDRQYTIPFLKDLIAFARAHGREPYFLASPWSPPPFMKTNNSYVQGRLKKECYPIFARYVAKFVEAYANEGIRISAVTLENEPDAGTPWESCRYTPEEEAEYAEHLYEALQSLGHEVKLLCFDHNKGGFYNYASVEYPRLGDKLWGAALHYYDGTHFDELELLYNLYPDKIMLATELSEGINGVQINLMKEIIGDLNHGVSGFQEWCMLLDETGAPYHNRPFGSNSSLVYDRQTGVVEKHSRWYKAYMFSHFIDVGATVLATSSYDDAIYLCAVRNPDGKLVVVIYNSKPTAENAFVKTMTENMPITLLPDTCYTLILQED